MISEIKKQEIKLKIMEKINSVVQKTPISFLSRITIMAASRAVSLMMVSYGMENLTTHRNIAGIGMLGAFISLWSPALTIDFTDNLERKITKWSQNKLEDLKSTNEKINQDTKIKKSSENKLDDLNITGMSHMFPSSPTM